MKFKIDENLTQEVATLLQGNGFEAHTVWDESLSGSDEGIVPDRARDEERALIPLDLDFANIHAYPPKSYPGIIVLRLKTQDKPTVLSYIKRVVAMISMRSPKDESWIVERD